MKRELSIDIETYSSNDLKNCGLYKYTEAPDFEIILFAWAFDDEDVQIVADMQDVPRNVITALTDPTIIKTAFNAAFEIACISAHLNIKLDPRQWVCTMVRCAMLGLPQSLQHAGIALNLDTMKDAAGKALIKYFCVPCKPTKSNGMRLRNLPTHDLMKWFDFQSYCCTDVQQERLIKNKIRFFKPPEEEADIWALDQKINMEGIQLDLDLAHAALFLASQHKDMCMERAIELTGLSNPGSNAQIKGWMESAIGEPIDSLNKKAMPALLKAVKGTVAEEILDLRNELSKTSVKKYAAMVKMICDDGRAKGLVQYCGAGRTWRWAGRGLQVHNLPRNTMGLLDEARVMVKALDLDGISMLWKSPPDVLSQLIRTAFVASEGYDLLSTDFSAIEARVTTWLAGEAWRIDVFNTHGKIYEASASAMFKVPLDTIVKGHSNYKLRQNGKVSELALGFGGGPGALINMGALDMDFMLEFMKKCKAYWDKHIDGDTGYLVIEQAEGPALVYTSYEEFRNEKVMKDLAKLVRMWRNANKKIVQYWKDVENAAIETVLNPGTKHKAGKHVEFYMQNDILFGRLPSGHCLTYQSPKLKPGKFNGWALTYLGVDQFTKRWTRLDTYGGKLVENIVQSIARDLLAWAMVRLDRKGFKIVMHVHDEVVLEVPTKFAASSVIAVNKIMAEQPPWAIGLPLSAESTISKYYKKD